VGSSPIVSTARRRFRPRHGSRELRRRARRCPGRIEPAEQGQTHAVADYEIPEPEPKEIDEKLAIELRHLADNAVLKAQPQGEEKCENCRYYFENTAEISYCWHPKLRILVGHDWWCQWWEAIPES
jgi:hypothetical protein